MRRVLALLVCAAASAPAVLCADGGELARWLRWVAERPELSRSNQHLGAWRQQRPQLEIELLGLLQRERDGAARRGAVIVLGVIGETPATVRALNGLGAEGAAAAARVGIRLELLATLRSLLSLSEAPPGSEGAAQLERVARALTLPQGRELDALLADPLFDTGSEGRPLRSLCARLSAWSPAEEAIATLADVARRPLAGQATRKACLMGLHERGGDAAVVRVLLGLRDRPQDWDLLVRGGLPLLDAGSRPFRQLCKAVLSDGGAWPDLQVMVAEELARRRAPGVAAYLEVLAREGKGFDRRGRLSLLVSLLRLDPRSQAEHAPELIEYALAGEERLADEALAALVELRPAGLGPRVSEVFNRPDPGGDRRVRAAQLMEVLGLSGQAQALGAIVTDSAALLNVRQAAAHALGNLDNPEGVVFLVQGLAQSAGAGPPAALRREIADALGACGARTSAGRAALEEALLDEEPTVRRSALRALARYGDPGSRGRLEVLYRQDPASARESQARLATASALGLHDEAIATLLLGLWRFHARDGDTGLAVVAYGRDLRADQVVETLLDLLQHTSQDVAQAAAAELLRRHPQGRAYGFDSPGATARRQAILAWREAWEDHPDQFR